MTKKVAYFPRTVLLVASLVISHLVVAETQHKPTLQLIKQLNYQVAMGFSWPFTFFLMWWIHWWTKWMDRKLPWQQQWLKRLVVQLVICVVLVLLIDLVVVRSYFWFFDNNFDESGYMVTEFQIITWMVFSMNATYVAWYFGVNFFHGLQVNRQLKKEILEKQGADKSLQQSLEVYLGNKTVKVSLAEIACFERHENIGFVHLLNGKTYHVDLTMERLLELVKDSPFYQINRSVLIALAVVKGYEKVKNLQAKVILKEDVNLEVSLLISRNRLEGFKLALSGGSTDLHQ